MTVYIPDPLVYGSVGFAAGAVVILILILVAEGFGVGGGPHIRWMSPARAAGFRRFAKLIFWPVVGIVASNATAWTIALLVHFRVDPGLANGAGLVVGAAVGGVHQGITWGDPTPPATQGGPA